MSAGSALYLVNPVIDLTTIAITSASAAYVARQKTSEYNQVKEALVSVHLLYIALVSLEFIRIFYSTPEYMQVYTVGNTTFVLLDVVLLTLVALTVYFKPQQAGIRAVWEALSQHPKQFTFFLLYCTYLTVAEVILLVYRPFTLVALRNIVGELVNSTVFSGAYLDVLLGILIIFIVYPSTLLFIASRKTDDPAVRRALIVLPISWIGIGAVILIFNGYVLSVARIDDSAIAYLIAASAFSASASIFRRATLLSGFFTHVPPTTAVPFALKGRAFSGALGVEYATLLGKEMLLDVDPRSNFERVARDIAEEFGGEGAAVFTFTSRGSPVQRALSREEGVKFFLLTDKVPYARPGRAQNEMLVPKYEISVLLNVIDKTLSANPGADILIIFDNLTEMILTIGIELTYKFVKQANALLTLSRSTAIFLISSSAIGTKETNVVRGLFNQRLAYDQGRLTSSSKA